MGKEVEVYFRSRASGYMKESQKGLWKIFREKEKNAIAKFVRPLSTDSVLDAGAGAGFYSLYFKNYFQCDVVAIDITKEMVDELIKNGINGRLASVETFKIDTTFDLILAAGVFEFLESPEKGMRNLASLMEQNGKMVLLVPSGGIIGYFYNFFHFNLKTYIRSIAYYEEIGNAIGLKVVAHLKATALSNVIVFEKIKRDI